MHDCPQCGFDAVRVSATTAPLAGVVADGHTVHRCDGMVFVHPPGTVDDAATDEAYIHLSPQS
jgi:hypothetical protein